ncbi:head-tail connector protein [Paraclostridium bifermentans]|uniref:head-tail connector protein n=1 Tax=Paraclostridium bifermentans TaxID=1490 RepID=UPI002431C52C|nr:head-tail connector protein [Paraclostridium bifermentans]
MTLEEVKSFIHVDFNDDDTKIEIMKDAAIEYIKDALGSYNEKRAKQKLLLGTLVEDMYNKESFTVNDKNESVKYIIKSIILQEQLEGDDFA